MQVRIALKYKKLCQKHSTSASQYIQTGTASD